MHGRNIDGVYGRLRYLLKCCLKRQCRACCSAGQPTDCVTTLVHGLLSKVYISIQHATKVLAEPNNSRAIHNISILKSSLAYPPSRILDLQYPPSPSSATVNHCNGPSTPSSLRADLCHT